MRLAKEDMRERKVPFRRQFVGLNLSKFDVPVADSMVLNSLAVLSGFAMPVHNCLLIYEESGDYRFDRASEGQQGQHHANEPAWVLEIVQWCTLTLDKGTSAPGNLATRCI